MVESISDSQGNLYACGKSDSSVPDPESEILRPAHSLFDALRRPSYKLGQIESFVDAANICRVHWLETPCPRRLTADELFDAVTQALDMDPLRAGRQQGRRPENRLRAEFAELFGYDPSTPSDEIKGTLAQALFLMNSRALEKALSGRERTPLATLLADESEDRVVLDELYLRTLSRFPSEDEELTCLRHVGAVGDRLEAFEDIFWCLLNSTEFQLRS